VPASNNEVTSIGGAVVFYGNNPGAINVSGSNQFNVTTPAVVLNSLDLYDFTVVSNISTLQSQGKIGGSLSWNAGLGYGQGNVILQGNQVSPLGFTAVQISPIATVTGQNFPSNEPFLVKSAIPVLVNGTIQFTTANSNPVITSNQNVTVNSSGTIFSLTDLHINAPSLTNSGTIQAASGDITVSGANGLVVSGSGSGSYQTPSNTNFVAVSGNLVMNAAASINGTATLSTTSASGQVQVAPGVTFSPNLDLTVNTANLLNQGTLASTSGNVNIVGAAGVTLTQAGVLSAANAGAQVNITATAGNVTFASNMSAIGLVAITASAGNVVVNAAALISSTQNMNILTPVLNNSGTINPTGLLNITGVNGLTVIGSGTLNTPPTLRWPEAVVPLSRHRTTSFK